MQNSIGVLKCLGSNAEATAGKIPTDLTTDVGSL